MAAAQATAPPSHSPSRDDRIDLLGDVPPMTCQERYLHVGNVSLLIAFAILAAGLALRFGLEDGEENAAARYVLSCGLFAFAGGATNWLAVKMLFDRVPFLYGSGVIPRRFKEIRRAVKEMFMKHFFDEQHMQGYLQGKGTQDRLAHKLTELLDSDDVSSLIDAQIGEALKQPQIMLMLAAFGMSDPSPLVGMFKPKMLAMAKGLIPLVQEKLAESASAASSVVDMRTEVDRMLEDRLQFLDAAAVKQLMQEVIRRHLHWLVVWGNFFGGLLGVISAVLELP